MVCLQGHWWPDAARSDFVRFGSPPFGSPRFGRRSESDLSEQCRRGSVVRVHSDVGWHTCAWRVQSNICWHACTWRVQSNICWHTCTWRVHSDGGWHTDRKSTRLNSSHVAISYAVFCLKKKKSSSMYCLCL